MATPPENLEPQAPTATEPMVPVTEKRNVNPQVLILVGLIVVILLAIVYFLFLSGGGGEEEAAVAPPAPVPAPTETAPAGDGDDNPVETFEVFAPRDPFEPLISAAGEGGTGTGGTVTGDGTTTTGDGTVTGDGTDGTVGGPGDDGTTGSSIGDHRVKVIDVYVEGGNDRAQIQVDGTVYTVDAGEDFAENFRLVSTSGQCATILFGDDEFTLCEGEEILK